MSTRPVSLRERRRRGTPVVQLNMTVDPAAQAKLDVIADALGKSEGIVFDLIMQDLDVDVDGRPAFWTGPLISQRQDVNVRGFRERRPRGTTVVQLNMTVDPAAKAKLDVIADAIGKSEGVIFDLIMRHLNVDADGRPPFWTGPLTTDPDQGDLFDTLAVRREAS